MNGITDVFWRPYRLFTNISNKGSSSVMPALLIFLVNLTVALVMSDYIIEEFNLAVQANPEMEALSPSVFLGFTLFLSSITPIITLGFVSLLMFLLVLIFEGSISYQKLFVTVLYVSIPSLISKIATGLAYYRGSIHEPTEKVTTVAFLFGYPENLPYQKLMSSIDFFEVWSFILMMLGLCVISDLKRAYACGIVLFVWGGMQLVYFRAMLQSGGVS